MPIRASSTLALVAAAMTILASASLAGCGADPADVRMVAFPASESEERVLDALSAAGVGDVIGASVASVPLSDFSAIVTVPFDDATRRSSGGDPRRTPLLDELERRFTVAGPGGTPWRVVHVPGSTPGKDKVVAGVLDALGIDWAWDAPERRSGSKYLWLPVIAWAAWLVSRKPRYDRTSRSILSVAWLPVLAAASPLAATLVVVLEAATSIAYPLYISGSSSRLVASLWPYAVAVFVVVCLEPTLLWYLAASAAMFGALAYLLPRIERLSLNRWLHKPPRFRPLTGSGLSAASTAIRRAALAPLAAILAVAVAFPGQLSNRDGSTDPLLLETGSRGGISSATAMMNEHLAYQYALTFGRLGDAAWGSRSFSSAYRYREKDGRLSIRDPDDGDKDGLAALEDRLSGSFRAVFLVLADRKPLRITKTTVKQSPDD